MIHLQAKPSCLQGSTMCRGALSVLAPFQPFLVFVMLCLVRFYLPVSVLIVLGAGDVPGARSPPAQGSGAGQWCPACEPKPAAHGSDLLAAGKGYPCWDRAPEHSGLYCRVPRGGPAVCRALGAAAGEATLEGLCREASMPVRKPSPSSICRSVP